MFEIAKKNAKYIVKPMKEVIAELMDLDCSEIDVSDDNAMYVLTNETKNRGAAGMFDLDLLSKTAEELSKSMGTYTALAGSVSRNKNDPSQSLNMIERPLMTSDELKSMKKGNFIVMKTGVPPMRATFKLFFKWGIQFDKEYFPEVRQPETIEYADVSRIIGKITGKPVLTSSDLKMQNELKSIFRKVQEDKVNEVS